MLSFKVVLLISAVTIENLDGGKQFDFNVTETGAYNVGTQNSITRNNEKNLINLLANEIADEILLEIKLKSDDL